MENQPGTQPGVTEKPAAARLSSQPQPANGQPVQQQFQPIDHENLPRPEPFKTSKPFSVAKLVLGSFNLVFAIIALGLSLGLIMTLFSDSGFIGVVICMSLAVVSIVWQLAEHFTIAVRRNWRSIHPGAHVGVHLVLWFLALLVALSLIFSVALDVNDYTIDPDCYNDSSYPYDVTVGGRHYCDRNTFATQAEANKYFRMLEALAIFSVLLLISHFTLFVMACVETDRRRKYGKRTKVVYLVASQGPADGRTYYTPIASHPLGSNNNRGSVMQPQPARLHQNQQQQGNADPGIHGYYAPPAGVPPGTAA